MTILLLASCQKRPNSIDFSTQVKPIINKHCITCHGGVKRNANFSLLFREDALDTTESGQPAIIPGDPDHSELIRRLTLKDPEERMPFKEPPLSEVEVDILRHWIQEGARWGDHWAYVLPKPVKVPQARNLAGLISDDSWGNNEIDAFVQQTLQDHKLVPSVQASKSVLLRRVSLDLTGIPPTSKEAREFLSDPSEQAYEKVVDRLLASPRFGEKWASWWLDMARYSDTKGYERDVYRNIWRYRDWVIRALNEDKPFDIFTTEQLAGDLLPNPTDDQLIATAFHRNTMNNDEGGTEDEEFRVAAVIDRVNTTMEVWQSTTIGCVQCHSHPYDPFRNEEYYQLMAFFNNTRDEDTEGEHPSLRQYREEDVQQIKAITSWVQQLSGKEKAREVEWFLKTLEPKYHPHDFDQFVNGELIDTKWLGIRSGGSARIKAIDLTGKSSLLINHRTRSVGGYCEIRMDKLNGEVLASIRLDTVKTGRRAISIPLKTVQGKHDLYFIFKNPLIKPDQSVSDIEWFAFRGNDMRNDQMIQREFLRLVNTKVDNTPIMVENTPKQQRPTYVFDRGNWLVHRGEVKASTPRSLNAFPKEAPSNRLGLAQWLVSSENPLTSRTIVNRVWEQFFGYGFVETMEDFGTQGALPTHPELLDWLALRLVNDHQWSLKKLMKDIVLSATYQQSSVMTKDYVQADPTNKWLSRGPRVRLSAEQVRDQALAVSGLLADKMYGPSVMPFQPDGVWQSVWSDAKWEPSAGDDQYRRALYIFQKRTSPYPSMMMFDGSSRDVCQVRRIRTNTPLQSLVTLNDPVYLEAAHALARIMMKAGATPVEQIKAGYERIFFQEMSQANVDILTILYGDGLKAYQSDRVLRKSLVKDSNNEEAAMVLVASALLNLDETLTKQ